MSQLTLDVVNSFIEKQSALTKITIESMDNAECYIRKFSRKDAAFFSTNGVDVLDAMVFVAILNDKGEKIFSSIDQVGDLPDAVVAEMFKKISEFNHVTVEDQAKK